MIAEQAKVLSQERSKLPSVQSMTDKMSRLTNRKPHNPKLLLNELTSGDRNVTFSGSHNNHSTAKPTSSEGKGMGDRNHNSHHGMDITLKIVLEIDFQFNIGWFFILSMLFLSFCLGVLNHSLLS